MSLPYTLDHPATEEAEGLGGRGWPRPRRLRGSALPLVTLVALLIVAAACLSTPKSPAVAGEGPAKGTNAASPSGPQSS
jgi:hypothetical protein